MFNYRRIKKSRLEFQKDWVKSLLKEREKSPSSSVHSQCCRCRYCNCTGGRCSLDNIRVGEQVPGVTFFSVPFQEHFINKLQVYTSRAGDSGIVCGKKGLRNMMAAVYLYIDSSCRQTWVETFW